MAGIFLLPYLQGVHFFFVHRGMHKWGTTSIPDVGAFLYKHVHSLHHKSRNPTVWSGISMHPVESAAYFSTMGFAGAQHPLRFRPRLALTFLCANVPEPLMQHSLGRIHWSCYTANSLARLLRWYELLRFFESGSACALSVSLRSCRWDTTALATRRLVGTGTGSTTTS